MASSSDEGEEKKKPSKIRSMFPMLISKIHQIHHNQSQQNSSPQTAEKVEFRSELDMPTILVPPRRGAPTLSSITPGRSLTSSVLGKGPTQNIKDLFKIGKLLGEGQFGKVHMCKEICSGEVFACKSISRSSLISEEDVEDVRKEVNILNRLKGQPHIVRLKGTYEDRYSVHIVMEFCSGGELFEQINSRVSRDRGPYTEKDASKLAKAIVIGIERCHSLGVMHRDLKPENFLLTSNKEDGVLKMADFGLGTLFTPGQEFSRVCGSAMYMAPEVVRLWQGKKGIKYGPEIDIWSAGIIIHILLTGAHPFPAPSHDRTDAGFMRSIVKGNLSFWNSDWKGISKEAKDLVKSMLQCDPKKRPTASQILKHPWIVNAPDSPLERDVVIRFSKFLSLLRLKNMKKVLMRAIASSMDEFQVRQLSNYIEQIDSGRKGVISLGEFCKGLKTLNAEHAFTEMSQIMSLTDLSESEVLEYKEFMAATYELCKIEKQENLFKAFSQFDEDLRGFITTDELIRACNQFKVDQVMMEEMIKEVNRDEEGRLDYNAFVTMMRRDTGGLGRRSVEGIMDGLSMKDVTLNIVHDKKWV